MSCKEQENKTEISTSEIGFVITVGYTHWDHKRNGEKIQELQMKPIIQHASKCELQRKDHI